MNGITWIASALLVAGVLALLLVTVLVRRSAGGKSSLLGVLPQGAVEELQRERRRAKEIIERMTEGVLVLDENLRPTLANRAAHRMLGLRGETLPPRLPTLEIVEIARRSREQQETVRELIDVFYPGKMALRVEAAPLAETSGVLVVLHDVSEEIATQRIRREFVAHASHELKSPVASLQTLADAIAHALPEDLDAAERFARKLVTESERLGKLVTDLLDLSRLEDPAQVPDEPVDLGAVARREVTEAESRAHERDVALTWEIEEAWVRGDPQHLALVVRNLLENALQYTDSGGNARLEVARHGDEVSLRVTDDGIGIPTEAQGRVFERFYRVDRARSRDRGGTGLGLAIVKHVAELHGGRVDVESELGLGSTFTMTLPSSDDAPLSSGDSPARRASSEREIDGGGAPGDDPAEKRARSA